MDTTDGLPPTVMIDGKARFRHVNPDIYRAALRFEPREGDVVVVGYPRTGSHWISQIIHLILNNGASFLSFADFMRKVPILEVQGAPEGEVPRMLKTHMRIGTLKYNNVAKYVFITRNPLDCCASNFHFMREAPAVDFDDGKFDAFLDGFLEGTIGYGDYFGNLVSGFDHRKERNVFFLTYEDLHRDKRGIILSLGRFLGDKYHKKLEEDAEFMQTVLDKSTLQFMKEVLIPNGRDLHEMLLKNSTVFPSLPMASREGGVEKSLRIVRNGTVGEWKRYFTIEGIKKMRDKIESKNLVSVTMNLWEDLDVLWNNNKIL